MVLTSSEFHCTCKVSEYLCVSERQIEKRYNEKKGGRGKKTKINSFIFTDVSTAFFNFWGHTKVKQKDPVQHKVLFPLHTFPFSIL